VERAGCIRVGMENLHSVYIETTASSPTLPTLCEGGGGELTTTTFNRLEIALEFQLSEASPTATTT